MRNWRTILGPVWMHRLAAGARRLNRSRGLVIVLAGLLLLGGIAAGSFDREDRLGEKGTRLDSFRDAAPFSFGFFEGWWGGSRHADEDDAITLITDEVREEFFREIPFGEIIHEKAEKYEIDPALVAAIVEVESAFETDARSSRGAIGLMQLRPSTARWMGARDLLDPSENIDAGTRYLKYLEKKFDGDLNRQLAAYNAGETAVTRYGGVPPYPETTRYIRKVMRRYEQRNRELKDFNRSWIERESVGGAD